MIMLGIETSGEVGSVALCRDNEVLAAYILSEDARHARDIVPAIDRVVARAGVQKHDIAAVAVSQGPGSFTGLRVGVTCAKTLAHALGWRAVGVPSLEVLARNVRGGGDVEFTCPILDARRDRVYGTLFRWADSRWRDTTGVLILSPQELADRIPEGGLVFGTGVRAYAEVFAGGRFRVGEPSLEVGRAEEAARLGLMHIEAGQDVDPVQLVPRYYRVTEAEEKLQGPRR